MIDAKKTPLDMQQQHKNSTSSSTDEKKEGAQPVTKRKQFDIQKEHERLTMRLRSELDSYENKPVPKEAKGEDGNH